MKTQGKMILHQWLAKLLSQLKITWHHDYTFGMHRAEVAVLKHMDKMCLHGFLQCLYQKWWKPQVLHNIIRDFTHQMSAWQSLNEQLGGLLLVPDLTEHSHTGLPLMCPLSHIVWIGHLASSARPWSIHCLPCSCTHLLILQAPDPQC